jgi:adenylate cyclase class IV
MSLKVNLKHLEKLLDGITVASMNTKSVAVGAVLAWNQAVVTVRKAAVEKRAREKAAAEAEQKILRNDVEQAGTIWKAIGFRKHFSEN